MACEMVGRGWLPRREDDAGWIDACARRGGPKPFFRVRIHLRQPQDAPLDSAEQPHPRGKYVGRYLEAVVEGAEYEPLLRQPFIGTARRRRDGSCSVAHQKGVGQVDDTFGIVGLQIERQRNAIRDDVIDKVRTGRARISEIAHLNGRRAVTENSQPRVLGVTTKVDRDVDLKIVDQCSRIPVVTGVDIMELIAGRDDAAALLAAVIRSRRRWR